MIGVALKGLFGRKLRASLTAIAIVLGVAMVSGTYILTDTIQAAFNTVFTEVYKNTDAAITAESAIGGRGQDSRPPPFSQALLTQVRQLPGVLLAEGGVQDQARLVGRNGKVISHGFGPGLAFSVNPHGSQRFNPLVLTSGHWPEGSKQVAIDEATAKQSHYALGDTIGVVGRGAVQKFRITGLIRFGGLSSMGGATITLFDLPTAQRFFHKVGKLDAIGVAAKPGVSPQELVNEISPQLPSNARVKTGQQEAKQATKDTSAFFSILRDFLLAFGGVALFVGTFVIANTLSITIAQRTRELATLRTLGATRRQVLSSVLLEAFVIGAFAAVAGLVLGLGLAKGLTWIFANVVHSELPQAGTVFATRTVVVSLLVGILVTLLAALRPAFRATRVEPIAAVREGAVLPRSRFARFGPHAAVLTISAALALMLVGLFVNGLTTKQRLLSIGVGAAALFVGVSMLAPTLVPPLVRVLGYPGARFGGAAGSLARGNSVRNPARTASTASAMMIGLALVTLVSVLAAGLKTTFETSVSSLWQADYALTSQDGFTPTGTASADALAHVPGVQALTAVRAGEASAFGGRVNLTAVQPNASRVIVGKWAAGGPQTPARLGLDGAFVLKDYAKSNGLTVGSPFTIETPAGNTVLLTVRGIFAPPKGGSPYGEITISTKRFDREYANPQNLFAFLTMRGGVTPANTKRLTAALARFPDAKIQTKSQFVHNQERGITLLLNLLYVLLSLSIVISLFGIVNTLVLTVFERTRELGMLRAVGMTRRQVRSMIRLESIVTALLGAALGIPVGVVLALMVGKAIQYAAFTIPVGTLVTFVIAAILAGLVAAIFPARRAGRLNVLEALQYE